MKKLILLMAVIASTAGAQILTLTNWVVLSGAGSAAYNGTFLWHPETVGFYTSGSFQNTNGNGTAFGRISGIMTADDYYTNTAFPASWNVYGGSAPAPTGRYLTVTNSFLTSATNYWTVANDIVTYSASGWDLGIPGTSSNTVTVFFGIVPVFVSPFTSGSGLAWSLSGSSQWDGTNLVFNTQFNSGDTNAQFSFFSSTVTNAVVGTNTIGFAVTDTNKLILNQSTVRAQRATATDWPIRNYTHP